MQKAQIPHTIGIIMDGNRRFAESSKLPRVLGHRAGYEKLREVVGWAKEAGVTELIVYAFSTENWKRSEEEVRYLMNLFREIIAPLTQLAVSSGVRMIFLGDRSKMLGDIVKQMETAERETQGGNSLTLAIALSYGGRAEIVDAVRRIPDGQNVHITEQKFSELLWTKELKDPDLIIRTGGDVRLSNFLPRQSVYSELAFTETKWPEFTKKEFLDILHSYKNKERRLGK